MTFTTQNLIFFPGVAIPAATVDTLAQTPSLEVEDTSPMHTLTYAKDDGIRQGGGEVFSMIGYKLGHPNSNGPDAAQSLFLKREPADTSLTNCLIETATRRLCGKLEDVVVLYGGIASNPSVNLLVKRLARLTPVERMRDLAQHTSVVSDAMSEAQVVTGARQLFHISNSVNFNNFEKTSYWFFIRGVGVFSIDSISEEGFLGDQKINSSFDHSDADWQRGFDSVERFVESLGNIAQLNAVVAEDATLRAVSIFIKAEAYDRHAQLKRAKYDGFWKQIEQLMGS